MTQLTPEGQRTVQELSERHGFSPDAVTEMLLALRNGNGSMGQFSHSEFGGSGQWMRGGMIMIGDLFNNGLKSRVDSLCVDISNLLTNEPGLVGSGSFQHQSQSGGGYQSHQSQSANTSPADHAVPGDYRLFRADPSSNWWPAELGSPTASGSQNQMRYAYFANPRRLAVDAGGEVWVYDTQDHQIGGFAQQQGGDPSISFTSQYGKVNLATLPVISRNGQTVGASEATTRSNAGTNETLAPGSGAPTDIYQAIEKLAALKESGILTPEEFTTKKAELLARL